MPNVSVVNPANPEDPELMNELFKQELKKNNSDKLIFIPSYQTHQITYKNKPVQISLTYPVFQYKALNDKDRFRFAVYENSKLGCGTFGHVYPIKAMWKLSDNEYKLKTKPTYVVKMSCLDKLPLDKRKGYEQTYKDEQQFCAYTKHLGSKYPIGFLNENTIFLLMKKQQGITLESFINQDRLNPRLLAVTQRLELTIRLLNIMKTQAHDIVLGDQPDAGHIIHSDIKPSNIMISEQLEVNLIDYGLSVNSKGNVAKSVIGTPFYTEPKLLQARYNSDFSLSIDDVCDLFSMGIVISELWGCDIRDKHHHYDIKYLFKQNLDIPLTNIFKHINDLTLTEKDTIRDIIYKMTRYHREDRMSYKDALSGFIWLLQNRINSEKLVVESLEEDSIQKLETHNLLCFIKSVHFPTFLSKINNSQRVLSHVTRTLDTDIILLPELAIKKLHQSGMNLTTSDILIRLVKAGTISPEKFLLLHRLGAPVNNELLLYWLAYKPYSIVYWVDICRVLMASLPGSDKIVKNQLVNKNFNHPLKEILFTWLIHDQRYPSELCVSLAKRHIQHKKNRMVLIEQYDRLQLDHIYPSTIFSFYEPRFVALAQVNELLVMDHELMYCSELFNLLNVCHRWLILSNEKTVIDPLDNQLLSNRNILLQEVDDALACIFIQLQSRANIDVSTLTLLYKQLDRYYNLFMTLETAFEALNTIVKPNLPILFVNLMKQFELAYQNAEVAYELVNKNAPNQGSFSTVVACVLLKKDIEIWLGHRFTKNTDLYFYKQSKSLIENMATCMDLDNAGKYYKQLSCCYESMKLLSHIYNIYQCNNPFDGMLNYKKVFYDFNKQIHALLQMEHMKDFGELKEVLKKRVKFINNCQLLHDAINTLKKNIVHKEIILQLESLFHLDNQFLHNSLQYLSKIDFKALHDLVIYFLECKLCSVRAPDDEMRLKVFRIHLSDLISGYIEPSIFDERIQLLCDEMDDRCSKRIIEQPKALTFARGGLSFFRIDELEKMSLSKRQALHFTQPTIDPAERKTI